MTFDDLNAGDAVFVDANTLIYHCQPHPTFGRACTRLMERIEKQDLAGFATVHILSETAHRLMTLEAISSLGWTQAGIGNRLRTHLDEVRKLTEFRGAVETLLQSKLQFLTVTPDMLANALALSQLIGLLTNDALLVAVMQAHGLTRVASTDADLDRVAGITRYGPV